MPRRRRERESGGGTQPRKITNRHQKRTRAFTLTSRGGGTFACGGASTRLVLRLARHHERLGPLRRCEHLRPRRVEHAAVLLGVLTESPRTRQRTRRRKSHCTLRRRGWAEERERGRCCWAVLTRLRPTFTTLRSTFRASEACCCCGTWMASRVTQTAIRHRALRSQRAELPGAAAAHCVRWFRTASQPRVRRSPPRAPSASGGRRTQ